MPVTKFIRVAVEGATADGRNISRTDIEQMGSNYDRNKYGARIWLEHLRGISADSQFRAYGDVLETKAEEVTIDGEKKLALFVKLDVTEELVEFNKKRQKIYTSMEVQPNFAKSGQAYLAGLAVTDSPASLGTEALKLFSSRKQQADNLFSVAEEATIEIEAEPTSDNLGTILFNKVKDLLGKKATADTENFTGISQAVEEIATSQKTMLDKFSATTQQLQDLIANVQKLSDDTAADRQAFTELKTQLENEPGKQKPRQQATGGNGQLATDC
jgi:hypothetical protein